MLDNGFAQDDNHLFFKQSVADFVDYPTFTDVKGARKTTYKDKDHLYKLRREIKDYINQTGETVYVELSELEIIPEADVKTYRLLFPLFNKKSTGWARDAKHVFRHNTVVKNIDINTFKPLTSEIVADKNLVYSDRLEHKISNKNKSSDGFKTLNNNRRLVYTTKYLYYVRNDGIRELTVKDIKSLKDLGSPFYLSLDNAVYYYGIKLSGADAKTFELIEKYEYFGRDKNHLFYKDELIEGINPQEVTYDKKRSAFFYRGKKWDFRTRQFK